MYSLLLTALVTLAPGQAADEKKVDAPKLDGKWLIVYSEEHGRRNTSWESKVATMSDGVLSYEVGKKKHSITLKFGHHQTVKAAFSEGEEKSADAKEHPGVYISGKDYFCLSLNHGKAKVKEAAAGKEKAGMSSGSFILILRRQRDK